MDTVGYNFVILLSSTLFEKKNSFREFGRVAAKNTAGYRYIMKEAIER